MSVNFTFTGTFPKPPEMPLRAKLAWSHFFEDGPDWACTRTDEGNWIITDESTDLDQARIFPDDSAFVAWLDMTAREYLEDDPLTFLRSFVLLDELVDDGVVKEMIRVIGND